MIEVFAIDQGEKIVIECRQYSVAFLGVRELLTVGITETPFFASGVNRPSTATQAISDRNPDTFVAVQRPHASAAFTDRNSSI